MLVGLAAFTIAGVAVAGETNPVSDSVSIPNCNPPGSLVITFDPVAGTVTITVPGNGTVNQITKVTRAGGGTPGRDVTGRDTNSGVATFAMPDTYLEGDGTSPVTYTTEIKIGDDCYRDTFTITPNNPKDPQSVTQISHDPLVSIPCP